MDKKEEKKFSRDYCIALLCDKFRELKENGENRFPQRADFPPDEVAAIKAYLGPWPRALEQAGIKAVDAEKAAEKQARKIAAKRRKTQTKIDAK